MKKDLIFAPVIFVIGLALFFLKLTGIEAHIAISAVGVALLVAYAVFTKKEWKLPILEIAMRVCYGIALISGVIIMNVYVAFLAILHKVFAGLFVAGLIAVVAHKFIVSKKV